MNYHSYPPHYVPAPPPKKPIPTWVLVLGTLATCFVFALFLGGVIAWRAWHSIAAADRTEIRSTADESWRAGSAPGAAEVNQLGCIGGVVDAPTMPGLAAEYADGPIGGRPRVLDVDTIVQCVAYDEAPTCQEVADTYVDAVPVGTPFRVVVENAQHQQLCDAKFDMAGSEIGHPVD